jgi:hypothetical protein
VDTGHGWLRHKRQPSFFQDHTITSPLSCESDNTHAQAGELGDIHVNARREQALRVTTRVATDGDEGDRFDLAPDRA